jgi:hypothetical protein
MQPADWSKALLETLAAAGEDGGRAAAYLRARGAKIGIRRARRSVGAFWSMWGNVYLNSRHYTQTTPFSDPYLLSLLVHEVRHLQQGPLTALSVYGELDAWQVGFRFFHQMTGGYPNHPAAEELMSLPLGWERETLRRARGLMRAYAGKGYWVDLLPLYPLPAEIRFHLTGRQPVSR